MISAMDKALPRCPRCGEGNYDHDRYMSAMETWRPAYRCRDCQTLYYRTCNGTCLAVTKQYRPDHVMESESRGTPFVRARTLVEAEAMERREGAIETNEEEPIMEIVPHMPPPGQRYRKLRQRTCFWCAHAQRVDYHHTVCGMSGNPTKMSNKGTPECGFDWRIVLPK